MSDLEFTSDGARKPPPWTQVYDWVALSGVSPKAGFLYWVIKMHLHVRSGSSTVKASTDSLAALCELSRGDKVKRYVDELEQVGAIESRLVGMPARKVYVVHDEPPPGYNGPLKLSDWYDIRKTVTAALRVVDNSEEPQVTPVPPKTGEQTKRTVDNPVKPQVSPVTPKRGEQAAVTPSRGEQDPPKRGDKQVVRFEQEELPPPGVETHEPAIAVEVVTEEEAHPKQPKEQWSVAAVDVLAEATALVPQNLLPGPAQMSTLLTAVTTALDAGWTPHALVSRLTDGNLSTARSVYAVLLHRLTPGDGLPEHPPARAAPPTRPREDRPWCGRPDCDPTTRQLIDAEGRPKFTAVGPAWCPSCSRHAARKEATR